MHKPTIIAICGKSATGKDTLAKSFCRLLHYRGINANLIVSDTTRPIRDYERHGIDYNFLMNKEFRNKIKQKRYLEYARFNGWLYGTDIEAIHPYKINIGVFNLAGISRLAHCQDRYNVICIYLNCNVLIRLFRSIIREKHFKLEFLRRIWVDYKDFKTIIYLLQQFPENYIFDTYDRSAAVIADRVINRLQFQKIIPYNKL